MPVTKKRNTLFFFMRFLGDVVYKRSKILQGSKTAVKGKLHSFVWMYGLIYFTEKDIKILHFRVSAVTRTAEILQVGFLKYFSPNK